MNIVGAVNEIKCVYNHECAMNWLDWTWYIEDIQIINKSKIHLTAKMRPAHGNNIHTDTHTHVNCS